MYKPARVKTIRTLNPFNIPSMSFTKPSMSFTSVTKPTATYRRRLKQDDLLNQDNEQIFSKWYNVAMNMKNKIESKGLIVKKVGIKTIGSLNSSNFKENYVEWYKYWLPKYDKTSFNLYPVDIYAEIPKSSVLWQKMREMYNEDSVNNATFKNPEQNYWVRYDSEDGYEILNYGSTSYQDSDYEGYIINQPWDNNIDDINDRNMTIRSMDVAFS